MRTENGITICIWRLRQWKEHAGFQKVIEQSQQDMAKHFFLMVPDQFTMYTQKEICEMHPRGGIMNIDVLSFSRLIHRIADEVGQKERVMLDDTGKNLVLRKVAADVEEELVLFQKKLKRPGYIHEVKSMLSEFISMISPRMSWRTWQMQQRAEGFFLISCVI